jgi:hypothetical protein
MLEVAIAAFNLAINDGVLPEEQTAVTEPEAQAEPAKESDSK